MKGDFAVRHQQLLNSVLDLAFEHKTLEAAFEAATDDTVVFAWTLGRDGQEISYCSRLGPQTADLLTRTGKTILGTFTVRASVGHLASNLIVSRELEDRNGRDIIVDTLLSSSLKVGDPAEAIAEGEQAFAVTISPGNSQGEIAEQQIARFAGKTFDLVTQKVVCLRKAPTGAVAFAIDCLRAFDEQAHQHDHHGLGGLAHLLGGREVAGGVEIDLGELFRRMPREEENLPTMDNELFGPRKRGAGIFARGRRD